MILIGKQVEIIGCAQTQFVGMHATIINETAFTLVFAVDTKHIVLLKTNLTLKLEHLNSQSVAQNIVIECTGRKVQW
jgi:RNase P/RNase MRP subunit p29